MASEQGAKSGEHSQRAPKSVSGIDNANDSVSSLSDEEGTSLHSGRTVFTSKSNSRSKGPKSRSPGLAHDMSSPEDGDDEDTDEEPDVIAPSVASRKRMHQTGLSISFSNTNLGKRGRSSVENDDIGRPLSKMRKMSVDVGTSDDDDNNDNTDNSDDDDDDDDYNAVDDISESEEEEDVEQLEEKMIIESEEDESSDGLRRNSVSSTDSIFALDGFDDKNINTGSQQFLNEFFPETSSTLLRDEEDCTVPIARRVRFAEEVQLHSNSSTTEIENGGGAEEKEGDEGEEYDDVDDDDDDEDDDDGNEETVTYPDLFLQQEALDPTFRKLIEQKDADERSSDVESYWDFDNDQHGATEGFVDSTGSETGSSGYETDEGETTDEEILPPRTVSKPQTSLRHNSRSNVRSKALQTPISTPVRKAPISGARRGPLMGSFLIDDDKPIAVVDGHGKHMLFFPAPKHRRQAAKGVTTVNSADGSALTTCHAQSETESDIGYSQTDPMLSSPANIMMSGLTNNRNRSGSALSSEITGPPEAFFPFTSINSNGMIETDDVDEDTFDEYSDEDDNLRIEDFINFGDDSSSEEEAHDPSQVTDSNNTTENDDNELDEIPRDKRSRIPGFKLKHADTFKTAANPGSLLEHFDRGVVSSFRRNNDRHKSWTRSPVNVGIKGGRLHAANALISPLRRRRGGTATTNVSRNPLSPQGFEMAVTASMQASQYQPFGGPLKKRISNSNHVRRERKNTI